MEPGLYLTFFAEGETLDQELPPVGPLEHVVIRERQIVADRAEVHRSARLAAGGRSNEAELELQRALGTEPGGARRPHLRIAALGGVYLRFASFGDPAEERPLPELGPYRVVVLGPRGVEADGELLAAPSGRTSARWELSGRAAKHGKEFMPDIAFRTRLTSYHPGIGRARRVTNTPGAAVHSKSEKARAPQASRVARARRSGRRKSGGGVPGQRSLPGTAMERQTDGSLGIEAASRGPRLRGLPAAAWRLRIGIIGALVLLDAVLALGSVRTALAPETSTVTSVVGIGREVQSSRWGYNVASVRRVTTAGSARARGVFLVLQVAATSHGPNGSQLVPDDFSLVDAQRNEYPALPAASAAYQGTANPDSPFVWTLTYPVGRSVTTNVIFDVDPSIRGPQLAIADVPSTRIRLD